MIKTDLLEKIKNAKDDEDINSLLAGTDIEKQFKGAEPTLDTFKQKIKSDSDFKKFMDSEKDKHLQKGIETFKTNNLQKLVVEEYKKQHPETDPKDTKMAELERKIELMEKEKLKESLSNKALKVATEKKLPIELIDFVVGADEETTNKNLDTLEAIFSKHDETLKADLLKDTSYTPPAGGGTIAKNPWSKDNFNLTLQGKLLKENPELAKKYLAEVNK